MSTSVVDFETDKIENRPAYPPKPVGVAIRWPSGDKEYLAWGHPTQNNCDVSTARAKLKDAYSAKRVIFHHSAFDIDVGECHLGVKPTGRVDDTLFLGFLKDPYTQELGLKPLAERDLGMPTTEQDELRDWILANVPKATDSPRSTHHWGGYISKAPGRLTGKYAIGDVTRTYKLYNKYVPEIKERGMWDAYERELACAPISMEMERSGVNVDRKRLLGCRDVFETLDRDMLRAIAKRLRIDYKKLKSEENPKGFNLNSSQQLADAMKRADKFDSIVKTPSGQICTKMDVLRETCNDKQLLNLLGIHSVAEKYLTSFIRPWLLQSYITGGRILPKFNQVRGYDQGGGGARTGRFSSSDPNMQNISANIEESKNRELLMFMQQFLRDKYDYEFIGLRDFLVPDEGKIIVGCDYDQQELRILAHFEKGVLMREYLKNPKLDVHDFVRRLIYDATGLEFFSDKNAKTARKFVKITVFGIVYGMGIDKLARQLDISKDMAKTVRDGVLNTVPGIPRIMRKLKRLDNHGKPMRTWGGREYFAEEPHYVKKHNRVMEFGYRLFNYKIQGSAADVTKQGMINVNEQVPEVRIAVQVHDELLIMAPSAKYGPRVARAMCDMKFRIPMTATAKYSKESWARLKEAA
jgi:DNA polymerase I-like protein with 3'-5' exonuclease and polymerase domains